MSEDHMSIEASAKSLLVLDPTTDPEVVEVSTAVRPASLDGKILGVLDNAKPNSDRILHEVARLLGIKYKVVRVVERRKPNASRGAPKELLDELAREAQFVVTGVGD